jgi:hypothetical protein
METKETKAPAIPPKLKVAVRSQAHLGHHIAGYAFEGRGSISVAEVTPDQLEEIRAFAERNAERFTIVEPVPSDAKEAPRLKTTRVAGVAAAGHWRAGCYWPAGVPIFYDLTDAQLAELEGDPGWEREQKLPPQIRKKRVPHAGVTVISKNVAPPNAIGGADYMSELQQRAAREAEELKVYERVKDKLNASGKGSRAAITVGGGRR